MSESESEEDREKKELRKKMKEEYYFAIQEEGTFSFYFKQLDNVHVFYSFYE